jgi:polyribonucleotide nucleotidyltransferase
MDRLVSWLTLLCGFHYRSSSAAVRIGSIDGQFVMNPSRQQMQKSDLNLVVSVNPKGHLGNVRRPENCSKSTLYLVLVMIDASANRLSDEKFFSALQFSVECCLPIIEQIKSLTHKTKRSNIELQKFDSSLVEKLTALAYDRLLKIFTDSTLDKIARDTAITLVRQEILNEIVARQEIPPANLPETFSYVVKRVFRDLILERAHRCDGRAFDQLRPINCQINLYEPLHGSALFQRGQTQVLCTVAFDALDSQYRHNDFAWRTGLKRKPFILHYEFPPYATNETGRTYGRADRRELGHGALAEKGVEPVVPQELPFMIRLTSEVLESNGSSSMASVCAAILALMDAGETYAYLTDLI